MTERQTIKRPIKLGNERLFDDHSSLISGKRLGLITNQSGVDLNLRLTADRLHEWPDCERAALFSPEHGVRGDHQDGVEVGSVPFRQAAVAQDQLQYFLVQDALAVDFHRRDLHPFLEQLGGIACHTGRESCFYRVYENGGWKTVDAVLKDPHAIYAGHSHE